MQTLRQALQQAQEGPQDATLLFRELTPDQQATARAQRPDDPWKSPKGDAARVMWHVGSTGELWPKLTMTAVTYGFSR